MLESTGKTVSPTGDESPSLPEELIFEVLLRVPVKSLLQFKCVSKSWKTLISNPQFAKNHLRTSISHPNTSQLQLFCPVLGRGKMVSDSVQSLLQKPSTPAQGNFFNMDDYDNRILGSCNGLLCLVVDNQNYVTLWNPSIRVTSKRFSTETYGEVLLPDENGAKICFPVLDVLRDCLCISFFDSKKDHWVVWLMKEYGVQCSWIKLMTIPIFIKRDCTWNRLMTPPKNVSTYRWSHGLVPLYISEDGVFILEAHFSRVVLYNLNDRRVHYPMISGELGCQGLHLYRESLVSPLC